jgi:hypothetical protein
MPGLIAPLVPTGNESLSNEQATGGYDDVVVEKGEAKAEEAPPPVEPVPASLPLPTVHEAELAYGPSGPVEYGAEIDEAAAVARRKRGDNIVVRGDDLKANRSHA